MFCVNSPILSYFSNLLSYKLFVLFNIRTKDTVIKNNIIIPTLYRTIAVGTGYKVTSTFQSTLLTIVGYNQVNKSVS